jgi:hypothetical protein
MVSRIEQYEARSVMYVHNAVIKIRFTSVDQELIMTYLTFAWCRSMLTPTAKNKVLDDQFTITA